MSYDPFRSRDPRAPEEQLRRHLARTGADKAAQTDAYAHLQIAMLRDMLNVVRAACDDEGIHPEATQRILDRVIYGCVPSRAEAEHRQRLIGGFDDQWSRVVPKPLGPPRALADTDAELATREDHP